MVDAVPGFESRYEWLEHVPVPAYVFRAQGDEFLLVAFNAAVRSAHPELGALLGSPMGHLYRHEPEAMDVARRCMRDGVVATREMAVRRYDRVEANQRLRLTFVPSPPDDVVVYAVDVAPPSLVQAALRESEERYRAVLGALIDGVLLRDTEGRTLQANPASLQMFGWSSEADVLGRQLILPDGWSIEDEHGAPIDPQTLPGALVLRTGSPASRLLAVRTPEKSRRWLTVRASPLFVDGDGKVSGAVVTFTDDTARHDAELALRDSTARLEQALAATRMGWWEWEPERDHGWWSENMYGLFQVQNAGRGLAGFFDMIHPDDRELVVEACTRGIAAAPEGGTLETEYRIVGEDDVVRWARSAGRITRANGRIRLSGTIVDITERRRLQHELAQAQRLESIGKLAGGIAHDFNNLLTAMLTSLDLVDEGVAPEAKDDVATIRHAAERARDLTGQLLAFARRQVVRLRIVDVATLVSGVDRMLRRLVGADVELVLDLDERAGNVHADPGQLEQVLVNLAVNAREAMPEGGRLEVRTSRATLDASDPRVRAGELPEGEYVVLTVADSGGGMDEPTKRHVFDPFFTTKETGTGLGLASCYGIVKQHGGHIVVESEQGRGSTFHVWLPRVVGQALPSVRPSRASTPGAECILLVEDDTLVRSAAERILRALGYRVLGAEDGARALAVSAAHPGEIDLLLCDVVMPKQSGPELARELLAARPRTKVLFVSGHAEGTLRAALGDAPFLQKPYSRAGLARAIREILDVGTG